MVGNESSLSSQTSSLSSKDKNDYSQWLHAFEELHNKANIIVVINNQLKGLNNWLENIVNQLEIKLHDLKEDFENLDLIYKNSTCYENKFISKPYENCTVLENKVKCLLKTCARFTRGKTNLEVVFDSQNCVFGKTGIDYNSLSEKKLKKFANFFSTRKSSDISFLSCNYCLRKGHVSKNYNARIYDVPKGYLKCIPKGLRRD